MEIKLLGYADNELKKIAFSCSARIYNSSALVYHERTEKAPTNPLWVIQIDPICSAS